MRSVESKKKIGEILSNIVEESRLDSALNTQEHTGGMIGEILLSRGDVNGKQLYSALAEKHGLEFVNLLEKTVNQDLISYDLSDDYIKHGAIPFSKENGKVNIAATNLSEGTISWINDNYPANEIFLTSPMDVAHTVKKSFIEENTESACNALWNLAPIHSARKTFLNITGAFKTKFLPAILFFSILPMLFLKPFFIAINVFYFMTLVFKASVFFVGMVSELNKKRVTRQELDSMNLKRLPVYTLLIPLFKEKKQTIESIISAVKALEYPTDKLDVKLIVEEGDDETIKNVKAKKPERIFDIIEVPHSYPQTKPKALNYALKYAKGKYVTIYDAEDLPAVLQLKEAVYRFTISPPEVVCFQGRLNYYNKDEKLLTRMFAFEYGCWFDFLLPGLKKLNIPIPLGGTSNHFKISVLKELLAWDPYNVTEDADLGIRIAARGYKTDVLDSRTWEEAPISIRNWIRQRSRWIKGHMQTYIVHTRKNNGIYSNLGARGALGFLFFLGAPCAVFFTLPFVLLATIYHFNASENLPAWFLDIAVFNLYFGITVHIAFAILTAIKFKWYSMMPYGFTFPLYWVLHSLASFKAVWQLIFKPHYWEKTEHGVSSQFNKISSK